MTLSVNSVIFFTEPSYPGDVAVPINRTTNDAEIKLIVNHVTVKFRQTFGHHRMTVNVGDSEYVVQMNVYGEFHHLVAVESHSPQCSTVYGLQRSARKLSIYQFKKAR